jgi:integrase
MMVVKAGKLVGIHLRPHDLRRHSATHASRSGLPIEIVSKIILSHSNLSTPKGIWEQSAMLRRSGGLRICMAKTERGESLSGRHPYKP